jgi:hypothetical protein
VAVLAVLAGALAVPGTARGQEEDLQSVLELMRADLNAYKVATINAVMRLSEAEAEKFWPIYRQYELELAAFGDARVGLIREYIEVHSAGTLGEAQAHDLALRWLRQQRQRLELWEEYHRKIEQSMSAERAASFLQIEHQMALFVDLNIAAEMPLVGVPGGGEAQ